MSQPDTMNPLSAAQDPNPASPTDTQASAQAAAGNEADSSTLDQTVDADESAIWQWFDVKWEWLDANQALAQLIGIAILLALAIIGFGLARAVALPIVQKLSKKSKFTWDDALAEANFFRWLTSLFPVFVMWAGVAAIKQHFHLSDVVYTAIRNASASAMVFIGMLAACSFLNGVQLVYARRAGSARRPIKGYVELGKIFVMVVGGLLAVAVLLGRDVSALMAGVGAMTAVVMLIFKDTILSAVASVQLTNQNMVRIGDWIEMPSVGADGDVIDIALHTVKVQNFDKTISTIPTYRLVTDTFRNWRGMSESGGRRIKRNITIDTSTIRFLNKKEVDRLGKITVLTDYIQKKKTQLEEVAAPARKGDFAVNQRQLTNVGTFRAYMVHYLRSHPDIHEDMTFLVRQLQPTECGLPLEIYLFTKTTDWVPYEDIQADIFDHLLAALPEFGLRAYQRPSGADLASWSETASTSAK